MSNVVSDYVHLFAGVFFGAVVTYVLSLNNNFNIQLDVNLNHKKVEDSENSVDSQSNVADFDVVYYDTDEDCEDDEEEDNERTENETNEETTSGNEGDTEEPKKDELKLD